MLACLTFNYAPALNKARMTFVQYSIKTKFLIPMMFCPNSKQFSAGKLFLKNQLDSERLMYVSKVRIFGNPELRSQK